MINDIIKKWYIWIILFVFVLVVPFAINTTYLVGYKNNIPVNTMISAGEAFQGYGSILSFVGSLLLGAIAIWQNRELMRYQKDEISKNEKSFLIIEQILPSEKSVYESAGYDSIEEQIKERKLEVTPRKIQMKITNYGKAVNESITFYYFLNLGAKESPCIEKFEIQMVIAPSQTRFLRIPILNGFYPKGFVIQSNSIYNIETYGRFNVIPQRGEIDTISDYQIFPSYLQASESVFSELKKDTEKANAS